MNEERVKRKLSAILSADVKDYSRLMGDDELATVQTLEAYREIIGEIVKNFSGRVVDSPGDNILAEFSSVVDAVECGIEIQKELKAKNEDLSENRRMEFRIGINLGDVIEQGERIYGDGVNIAARIEGLAEAGGICISGTAYDHVKNKLGLEYEYLGEQEVKNIAEPVRVYQVLPFSVCATHGVVKKKKTLWRKWLGLLVILVVLVLGASALVWNFYLRLPTVEVVSKQKADFSLPSGPSVAVLPFVNLSGDPEQEYFVDGLTQDVITSLSGSPRLLVIARNSTFTFKGKAVNVQQVARELGVGYVVKGSAQRVKDRVRITIQLVNASTGHHIWSEKYDRGFKDILALQDEITVKIFLALEIKLKEGEQARMRYRGAETPEAYLIATKAREHFLLMTREANALARKEAEEAITLMPENSSLYSLLAAIHLTDLVYGSTKSPIIAYAQANRCLKKALALDEENSDAHSTLGTLYLMRKQHDKAIAAAERGVALNPNGADAFAILGWILSFSSRPEEGVEFLNKAFRLNPLPPGMYFSWLGLALNISGRYEDAIASYKLGLDREPTNPRLHIGIAASYVYFGQQKEAQAEASEVFKLDPEYSLEDHVKTLVFRNKADTERYVAALREAGLK